MSGWVRIENIMPEGLKVARVSDRAFRLWVHAICYCSRGLTDGKVPVARLMSLSPTANKRTVEELLAAGLLERVDSDTYRVHDYLDYNPSRARIEEMREATKGRVAKWREKHIGNAVTNTHETALVTPTRATAGRATVSVGSSLTEDVLGKESENDARARLPAGFPEELTLHLDSVLPVLVDLAVRHGARAVSRLSLASVILARRFKPLVKAAHDYVAWADGRAARRKDVLAGYRNWLDRTDDLAGYERLDESGRPAGATSPRDSLRPDSLHGDRWRKAYRT